MPAAPASESARRVPTSIPGSPLPPPAASRGHNSRGLGELRLQGRQLGGDVGLVVVRLDVFEGLHLGACLGFQPLQQSRVLASRKNALTASRSSGAERGSIHCSARFSGSWKAITVSGLVNCVKRNSLSSTMAQSASSLATHSTGSACSRRSSVQLRYSRRCRAGLSAAAAADCRPRPPAACRADRPCSSPAGAAPLDHQLRHAAVVVADQRGAPPGVVGRQLRGGDVGGAAGQRIAQLRASAPVAPPAARPGASRRRWPAGIRSPARRVRRGSRPLAGSASPRAAWPRARICSSRVVEGRAGRAQRRNQQRDRHSARRAGPADCQSGARWPCVAVRDLERPWGYCQPQLRLE